MKLAEILSEQYYSNPRGDERRWHDSMVFDKQIEIVRSFLKQYPVKSVIYAYKEAVNSRKFHPEDVDSIRKTMSKYNWNEKI